jgi:sugar phosphate isomerase/epimerase
MMDEARRPKRVDLGLSTSILPQRDLPDGLALLAAAGPIWIEIHGYTREEFDFGDRGLVGRTKQAIARHGLRLWSCHSPAYAPLDVASPDADLRARSCAAMDEAMEVSAELGARVFVCDAVRAYRDAEMRETRQPLYADSLRRLQRTADRVALRLAIENKPREWGPVTTPEDFLRLVTEYDLAGLGACWDTGHGWIAGQPPHAACRLGTRLASLHVHENDGQRDQHRPPGTGTLPWRRFVEGLHRIGYNGPFMLELAPPDPPNEDAIRRAVADAVGIHGRFMEWLGDQPCRPPH